MAEVIVALDFPDRAGALSLLDRLGSEASFFKIGLELFTAEGPALVREIRGMGKRVFLDLKLHDIPNTVGSAAAAAAELEVDLLTLHASGGARMIEAARKAVEGSSISILAVTVLTSLSSEELAVNWGRGEGEVHAGAEVTRLAHLAVESGAHGIVASALEASSLRGALGPDPLLVTPGIRLPGDGRDDQVRVATPRSAVESGASHLVIGRPITRAADPAAVIAEVKASIQGVAEGGR